MNALEFCEIQAELALSTLTDDEEPIATIRRVIREKNQAETQLSMVDGALRLLKLEINCRIEHGAEGVGHLKFIHDKLETILEALE